MVDSTTTPLILDMLEWLAETPRSYVDAMEAWRTSCPRLTVWEDAADQGLITRTLAATGVATVEVTPLGVRRLAETGRIDHPSI